MMINHKLGGEKLNYFRHDFIGDEIIRTYVLSFVHFTERAFTDEFMDLEFTVHSCCKLKQHL